MEVSRAFEWTVERFPEKPAITGSRPMNYREWDIRTNQIANALLGLGVEPHDRVVLFLSNSEVLASTHLALQKIRAMSTPFNIRLSAVELSYCLDDSEPRVVIVDDVAAAIAQKAFDGASVKPIILHAGNTTLKGSQSFEDLVAAASTKAPDIVVGPDDPSVMLYTSGTTGKPKGVPRTQLNEYAASSAHVMQCQYSYDESTLGAMPMYHTMGIRSLISMIIVGGKFVEQPIFNAERAIQLIESEQISALYLVPTAYWSIVETGQLSRVAKSVRKLAFAGAAMTSSLCEQLDREVQPEVFVNHYGSSEIYTYAIENKAGVKPGSAGRPGLLSRLRVVDPSPDGTFDSLPTNDVGEIVASLRSDEAFQGYWRRPDADEKAIHGEWYRTGDLGHIDENGDLWVDGRVDDMIITGGENVHPIEVEDIIARHPNVAEVAVVGLKDDKWGQAVTAFVVPRVQMGDRQLFLDQINDWLRNEAPLSPYKRPKEVRLIPQLPKNPVGKILRRKLVSGEYETE